MVESKRFLMRSMGIMLMLIGLILGILGFVTPLVLPIWVGSGILFIGLGLVMLILSFVIKESTDGDHQC